MNVLVKFFFRGLLVVVPAVATVFIVSLIFTRIDRLLGLPIPGAGFVVTLLLITLVGFLMSNFITRRLFDGLEQIFRRLPLVKLVYSSVKDLIGAFVGEKKSFDKPVLVTLSEGACVVGFLTRDGLHDLGLPGHVAVYFPQAYAFAGHVLVVPRVSVRALAVDSADAMAFVVSGGVSALSRVPGHAGTEGGAPGS